MPLQAAVFYSRDLGWAVVPGCGQGEHGRRCGRADCLNTTPHPVTLHGELAATCDHAAIRRWWRQGHAASILLPAGHRFDVLDVPAHAAAEAALRLELMGYRLGPVAQTRQGRLLIWVRSAARILTEPHEPRSWPYTDLDLHHRSIGDYVIAPPSCGSRWLDPPNPYTEPTLPHCADIVGTVAHLCRQRASDTNTSQPSLSEGSRA